MSFENFPTNSHIPKKALELEDLNARIENMPRGVKREESILEADRFNCELERMEKMSGLSSEEIMREYEKLNLEMAEKGLGVLLEELQTVFRKEDCLVLKNQIDTGFFDGFLEKIKRFLPSRMALATACLITISSATWANNASANQMSQNLIPSSQISMKATSSEQQESQVLEKAQSMTQEANQKAKLIIDNAEGFIKSLAQKEIIDEVANNSAAIIAYLNNTATELPKLNGRATELLRVYTDTVKNIDGLGSEIASKKFRRQLIDKISLVATKDYSKIKAELS